MGTHDEEFEKYLSEFRPRAVRTLELPRLWAQAGPRWLATAAVLLICAGSGLWYGRRAERRVSPASEQIGHSGKTIRAARPSSFSLTKLALNDDAQFQAELAAESRMVLPNFQDPKSTLRVLIKE
jgi:hypothetical protein